MTGCTIRLWYNKQRIKKNGNVSLYLQIICKGESDEVPLKIEWPADKFDWDQRTLKARYPGDTELLNLTGLIENTRAKYWQVAWSFIKDETEFTLSDIFKRANLYGTGHQLADFMEQTIKYRLKSKEVDDRIKWDTGKAHRSTMKKVKEFTKGNDVAISKVDHIWLKKFANHLRLTLCENSVWARIKDVKTYLSYAKRHKITVNENYKLFTVAMDEPDPVWLEEPEVLSLLELYQDITIHPIMRRNLRAFLFACFTGLRISDLSRWNKSWITGDLISFVPTKRRLSHKQPKQLLIPIIPIARDFIDKLESDTFELPVEQAYNRELKNIAEAAGIKKRITSHVARHTFATWLAIDGVKDIVISKLLGHKSTKTTMVYIHVAERYKAIEMMKLQKRFGLNGKIKTNN